MVVLDLAILGSEAQGTSYSNTEGIGLCLVDLGFVEEEASMANSGSTCGAIIWCLVDR